MSRGKHLRAPNLPKDPLDGAAIVDTKTLVNATIIKRGADISFFIQEKGDSFEILTVPSGDLKTFDATVEASDRLHDRMVRCLSEYLESGDTESLKKLAALGLQAFHELVASERIRNEIITAARDGSPLRIDVNANKFQFPWNLLYLEELSGPVNPRSFLGFAHMVSRVPLSKPNQQSFLDSRPASMGVIDPNVTLALHSSLMNAKKLEIPYIRHLGKARGRLHKINESFVLPSLDPAITTDEYARIRNILLEKSPHILHFSCHGNVGTGSAPSSLEIDDNFKVECDLLTKSGFTLKNQPIVFMNACEMGMKHGGSFVDFQRVFFNMGARALLAPECKISDKKASHFSRSFYKYFVRQHNDLAMAAYKARRSRLKRDDYSGLAYSLFGQPETRLDEPGA
jgi:hypothetical protein